MKQQCHIAFVYGGGLILLGGMVFHLLQGDVLQAVLWVGFVALFLWLYARYFPSLSRVMGYGSVADQPATELRPANARVTLYTGLGCPFCPLVKQRLNNLRAKMGFELNVIDVTLVPGVLIAKGIRSLPVVEVAEARWVGNATREQLAAFIAANATSKSAA